MLIHKIINHNIVISKDANGNEVILMGCGIAFNKKKGEEVDTQKLEKKFHLEKEVLDDNFLALLSEIPEDIFQVTHEIITYIKENVDSTISNRIYLTLLDHVHYAVQRYLQGIYMENMLIIEIKHLYGKEIELAKNAVAIINERLMINLPEDEAAFIALHIANAILDLDISDIQRITTMVNEILNIVRYQMKISLDDSSISYARFITHLKFFARRLLKNISYDDADDIALYEMVKERYPNEYKCMTAIETHVKNTYKQELSLTERLYLTMHLTRLSI